MRLKLSRKSNRKVKVKTPGGRVVLRYRKKQSSRPSCADCGNVLAGVAHGCRSVLAKLSKSQKRPERPFGGKLCSRCSRRKIMEREL